MKRVFYLILVWMLNTGSVWADQGGGQSDSAGTTKGQPSITDPLGVGGIQGLFNRIIDGLLLLAGPIAVIMLIYAGYLFVTAADNEEKVKTARSTIKYVVIGIAVLVLSKAIVYVACDFLGVKCN